jgi:succinate-acetate transporter protein
VIGFFRFAHGMSPWFLHAGGWAGIVTAAIAWYASAAGVINGMSSSPVLPVGRPLWGRLPSLTRAGSSMPRHRAA